MVAEAVGHKPAEVVMVAQSAGLSASLRKIYIPLRLGQSVPHTVDKFFLPLLIPPKIKIYLLPIKYIGIDIKQ